jgi:L-ascorbate metabolism protein UlaG (beta-lactamase superfamily)
VGGDCGSLAAGGGGIGENALVIEPVKSGRELIEEIDQTLSVTPALWWLGHAGFVVRFANITFYVDPCLTTPEGRRRNIASPLEPSMVRHADMIFATHAHAGHMDPATIVPMLAASRTAKLVFPKCAEEFAHAQGIPYTRMSTTSSGLRIEYFKENLYGRVYAVPSAHPELSWTDAGGHPTLGYLIRFGRWTVYHAGDCRAYEGLAGRIRPYNPTVLLLPIGGNNFSVSEAAQLAEDVGAKWLVPMHYGTFDEDRETEFVTHMLGHRPEVRFRTFRVGEKWVVPEE